MAGGVEEHPDVLLRLVAGHGRAEGDRLTDRVRLDLQGQPSALVDVTPAAVAELGLGSGDRVWLSTKATELEVYGHADPADQPGATPGRSSPRSP